MLSSKVVYMLLLIMTIGMINNYPGTLPTIVFFLLLSLPLISIFYCLYVFLNIKFTQTLAETIVPKGTQVELKLELKNTTFIPFMFIRLKLLSKALPDNHNISDQLMSIKPRGQAVMSFKLKCLYCGFFDIGIDKIYIEDFLGIFRFAKNVSTPLDFLVMPNIIQLDSFKSNAEANDDSSEVNGLLEDLSVITDIRKYNVDDSMKYVHWKLSAKKNELLIKSHKSVFLSEITILLDTRINPKFIDFAVAARDILLESVIAIVNYLTAVNTISFVKYSENFNEAVHVINKADFEAFYNEVSRIKLVFENEESLKSIDLSSEYSDIGNLILVTSAFDESLFNFLSEIPINERKLVLVDISSSENTSESKKRYFDKLRALGTEIYSLNENLEIKSVLEAFE
jgi:hypothetical protein